MKHLGTLDACVIVFRLRLSNRILILINGFREMSWLSSCIIKFCSREMCFIDWQKRKRQSRVKVSPVNSISLQEYKSVFRLALKATILLST